MKRSIILVLTLIFAVSLIGCSTSLVEKEPVVIKDNQEAVTEDITTEELPGIDSTDATDQTENDTNETMENVEDEFDETTNTTDNTASQPDNSRVSSEPVDYVIELEGMEEIIKVKTYESDLGYNMIYDVDRFTAAEEHGADLYYTENPNPDLYPYVYVNIIRTDHVTLKEYVDTREETLSLQLSEVEQFDKVTVGEYDAVQLKGKSGSEWNSVIRNLYIIESGTSIYEIETQYFMEAAEGYGSRIAAMLDTFTITK
jgi:hypothetical protein